MLPRPLTRSNCRCQTLPNLPAHPQAAILLMTFSPGKQKKTRKTNKLGVGQSKPRIKPSIISPSSRRASERSCLAPSPLLLPLAHLVPLPWHSSCHGPKQVSRRPKESPRKRWPSWRQSSAALALEENSSDLGKHLLNPSDAFCEVLFLWAYRWE